VNRMELDTRVSSVAASRDSWTTLSVWVTGAVLFGSLAGGIRCGLARGGANRIDGIE
jgi:hypothetical protein